MSASVLSMGGTTLETMIPPTLSISRPAGAKRLRKRIPHSSAVCSWTVRSRHWLASVFPSKAPMVMLLLPASSASSTNASCQHESNASVVAAHAQEPGAVQARRDPAGFPARLVHHHALAADVTGAGREAAQNGLA